MCLLGLRLQLPRYKYIGLKLPEYGFVVFRVIWVEDENKGVSLLK